MAPRSAVDRGLAHSGHGKACRKCKRVLPLSAFGVDLRVRSKLKARCGDCCADACREIYAKDPEGGAARQRERPRDAAAARQAAKRSDKAHPDRRRARELIKTMIRRGDLPRASECTCTDCPAQATAYDHAQGYDGENAKIVEPVCYRCHGARGRARGEFRRPKWAQFPNQEHGK